MTNEAWKSVADELGLRYRQRSVSKALATVCLFHDEKSPSLWLYPSGNYICYGCGASGTVEDFVQRAIIAVEQRREMEQWLKSPDYEIPF